MKILFTGASSFTGLHFVNALVAAGHEVICPLRKRAEEYEGLRRRRLEDLRARGPHPVASFGTEDFLKIIRDAGQVDLLCHHAAEVTNYKSPDFDPLRALENNTANLREVLNGLRERGGKAVLLTGTVFEMDEGNGDEPLQAFSPYGLSKGLTWQVFRHFCRLADIRLGKFVIPNPFGPWEDPRFTGYLMTNWKEGKCARVQTPDYVRDNIHVDLLAGAYAMFAEKVVEQTGEAVKLNPSGYVGNQGRFAEQVATEVRERTGWPCELELMKQEVFSEPKSRFNTEAADRLVPQWNERAAWDRFVEFYTAQTRG